MSNSYLFMSKLLELDDFLSKIGCTIMDILPKSYVLDTLDTDLIQESEVCDIMYIAGMQVLESYLTDNLDEELDSKSQTLYTDAGYLLAEADADSSITITAYKYRDLDSEYKQLVEDILRKYLDEIFKGTYISYQLKWC